jgi:hypothetical protein
MLVLTMFVLYKWAPLLTELSAKFNELTRHSNIYQEFPARTHMLTRRLLDDPTKQKVVASVPWPFQLWLVDVDCAFYDIAPTTVPPWYMYHHTKARDQAIDTSSIVSSSSPDGAIDVTCYDINIDTMA